MICKIADLVVQIPDAGGLAPRCKSYSHDESSIPDIVIEESRYRKNKYPENSSQDMIAYMESAYQFYLELILFDGLYLHSSAVVKDGRAYLFSGHCGAGKSTHARLWRKTFGDDVVMINDDKPALRKMDGIWYAYGTPWCGKDGINCNMKAPLAGICFMKKAKENKIRRLSKQEAMEKVLAQTIRRFPNVEMLDRMLGYLDNLLEKIPVYELENLPESEAAVLSYQTMVRAAQEAGL